MGLKALRNFQRQRLAVLEFSDRLMIQHIWIEERRSVHSKMIEIGEDAKMHETGQDKSRSRANLADCGDDICDAERR